MALKRINKVLIFLAVYYLALLHDDVYGYPQRNYYQRQTRRAVYPSNNYYSNPQSTSNSNRRIDESNSKFAGAGNQEEERTFHKKNRFFNNHNNYNHHHRPHNSYDPCRGRSADDPQGRFFWDLNVYNVYPNRPNNYDQYQSQRPLYDCGGGNGNGGGSYNDDYRPPNRPVFSIPISRPPPNNYRPPNNRPAPINNNNNNNNNQNNGDIYDPVNDDRPVTENIPNDNPPPQQLYLTPGQAVGGIASTVNSVIQTLTGNNRPGRRGQSDSVNVQTLAPGDIVGGLANTVNSVIQTLSGNGPNGGFLDSLYSGFNFF